MRQVPQYLIIGNGRVAKHFQAYFSQRSIHYLTWSRQQSLALFDEALKHVSHVLLLISDRAIVPFIEDHLQEYHGFIIHFSGSLVTPRGFGAHPLMTFSHELYSTDVYEAIPFIIDDDAPDFHQLLPGLPNPYQRLLQADKAKYHALCVMSGNFSCLLWQQFFKMLQQQFHWPVSLAYPYLRQQMKNMMDQPMQALTGPLIRKDKETLQRNVDALADHPLQALYLAFINFYEAEEDYPL